MNVSHTEASRTPAPSFWESRSSVHNLGAVVLAIGVALAAATIATSVYYRWNYRIFQTSLAAGIPVTLAVAAIGTSLLCKKEFWNDPKYRAEQASLLQINLWNKGYDAIRNRYLETKQHQLISVSEILNAAQQKNAFNSATSAPGFNHYNMVRDGVISAEQLTELYAQHLSNFPAFITQFGWTPFELDIIPQGNVQARESADQMVKAHEFWQIPVKPIHNLVKYGVVLAENLRARLEQACLFARDVEREGFWNLFEHGIATPAMYLPTFIGYLKTVQFTDFCARHAENAQNYGLLTEQKAVMLYAQYRAAHFACGEAAQQAKAQFQAAESMANARRSAEHARADMSRMQSLGTHALVSATSRRDSALPLLSGGFAVVNEFGAAAQKSRADSEYSRVVDEAAQTRDQAIRAAQGALHATLASINQEWTRHAAMLVEPPPAYAPPQQPPVHQQREPSAPPFPDTKYSQID